MSLLHPSSAGAPVALWCVNDRPARLVFGVDRYRVEHAERTASDGWRLVARDITGRANQFEVAPVGSGWELVSAR